MVCALPFTRSLWISIFSRYFTAGLCWYEASFSTQRQETKPSRPPALESTEQEARQANEQGGTKSGACLACGGKQDLKSEDRGENSNTRKQQWKRIWLSNSASRRHRTIADWVDVQLFAEKLDEGLSSPNLEARASE